MKLKRKAIMLITLFGSFLLLISAATTYAACSSVPNGSYPKTLSSNTTYCLTDNVTVNGSTAFILGGDNITFDLGGFQIINSAPSSTSYGVYSSGAYKNITIRNGSVSGFYGGIFLEDTGSGGVSNAVIDGINVSGYRWDGISISGSGNIVRNCKIYGGSPSDYGIVASGSRFSAINNDVYDVYEAGIWVSGGDNVVIENNRIVGLSSLPSDYWIGIEVETPNSLIVNNRIRNFNVGISFENDASGKYRDNLTAGCSTSYAVLSAIIDAGNNN